MPFVPSDRFKVKPSIVPGPGRYETEGDYTLIANNSKSKPFSFGKSLRRPVLFKEIAGKFLSS